MNETDIKIANLEEQVAKLEQRSADLLAERDRLLVALKKEYRSTDCDFDAFARSIRARKERMNAMRGPRG